MSLTGMEGSTHNSADAEDILENETPKKKHGKRKEKVISF
jgi:hypothetical protein